ncbi:Zn(II)-binding lipoprotein [Neobacillus bataviensis LMG 21833]|uniref:Zn(II)-binding lipoprotein n=1 Tax=Neobacillus bataviensis LMG 21833 TaxID=1117379 RepID=K6DP40_9BACI|nr:metal ABC transporter substrate-binding protein [Neobacillus bataviensis]EKN70084.1 Zn(II)-binding lipoprotein [Neobacillus bataviensis LMG 21833]
MKKNKITKIIKTGVVTIACLSLISACSSKETANKKESTAGDKKLHIVTTFYPMYEFTKSIAGDQATVDLLIPANSEPHGWEPTPKDMANIQNADILVYNSPFFETWVPSVVDSLGKNKKPLFIEASEGIALMEGTTEEDHGNATEHDHKDENGHDHVMDPHVWLSPALAQKEVETITVALVKKDPKNKEVYEKNGQEYIQQLKELDQSYRDSLIDYVGKEIITQHAAFGYLTKEYGLNQVPIAGLSPEEEPSAARLAELKTFAQEHNLHTIYFEELASPKVAETLASEIGAKTKVLNTLEGLSKEDQAKGLNYIEVMKNNLKSLVETLSQ